MVYGRYITSFYGDFCNHHSHHNGGHHPFFVSFSQEVSMKGSPKKLDGDVEKSISEWEYPHRKHPNGNTIGLLAIRSDGNHDAGWWVISTLSLHHTISFYDIVCYTNKNRIIATGLTILLCKSAGIPSIVPSFLSLLQHYIMFSSIILHHY